VELADGPSGCGEMTRGECSFAQNFSVTRTAAFNGGGEGGEKCWTKQDAVAGIMACS